MKLLWTTNKELREKVDSKVIFRGEDLFIDNSGIEYTYGSEFPEDLKFGEIKDYILNTYMDGDGIISRIIIEL